MNLHGPCGNLGEGRHDNLGADVEPGLGKAGGEVAKHELR